MAKDKARGMPAAILFNRLRAPPPHSNEYISDPEGHSAVKADISSAYILPALPLYPSTPQWRLVLKKCFFFGGGGAATVPSKCCHCAQQMLPVCPLNAASVPTLLSIDCGKPHTLCNSDRSWLMGGVGRVLYMAS